MKHGSSGVVAIPKAYRDYHGLKHGDVVTVLYDSLLLIVPKDLERVIEEKKELIDKLLGQGILSENVHRNEKLEVEK